jgi:hypothetical protein
MPRPRIEWNSLTARAANDLPLIGERAATREGSAMEGGHAHTGIRGALSGPAQASASWIERREPRRVLAVTRWRPQRPITERLRSNDDQGRARLPSHPFGVVAPTMRRSSTNARKALAQRDGRQR